MAIVCIGTGKAVPSKKITNTQLPAGLETSDEWIKSHTGIGSRFIAAQGETVASLGAEAARQCLTAAKVRPEDIRLIVCATSTPDYAGFPSSACLIQHKLCAANAAAFDLSAACSGFSYGLETAASLMERGSYRYALLVGADVLSPILDWQDRSTCVLFGDGAGALLLERAAAPAVRGVGVSILGADGSGEKDLFVDSQGYIRMNGRAVYIFAIETITKLVHDLLAREKLTIEDIDLVVCHQANARIIQAAAKKLGCSEDIFVINMEKYGNTSAASIPIALADLCETGRLKPGMTILTAGFGAGLTWGGCIIQW